MAADDENEEAYRRQAEADDRRREAETRAREVSEGWEYLRRGRTGLAIGRIAGPEAAIQYYEAMGAAQQESEDKARAALAAMYRQLQLAHDELTGEGPIATAFRLPHVQLPLWLEERFEQARALLPLVFSPTLLADLDTYAGVTGDMDVDSLARLIHAKVQLDQLSRMVAEYSNGVR
jgi:hypothetical protein